MSEGPTVAGSIVAKIKADRSDWKSGVAATMAEAKALESLDPKIRVDTDAKSAIADLDGAARATARLGSETDRASQKTVQWNNNLGRNRSHLATVATAVGALVPLLAPVGAAAVGVGGAFLGMGAAGVLALVGIHHAMEEGTALGQEYSTGVNSLKTAFTQLSSTAAVSMLTSFNRVVSETNAALPQLNEQIAGFAAVLGRSGANVVSGLISSFETLNPLFMTAARWVEDLSEGFQTWASGGGIEKFASYAQVALPQVIDLLGALGTMVLHTLEALAPLGAIGVAALTSIADVISAIPVGTLTNLIGMITWGAIAFKTWAFIAPMLAGIRSAWLMLTGAMAISAGPIGWVAAAVAALASVIAIATVNTESLTTETAKWQNLLKTATSADVLFKSTASAQSLVQPLEQATLAAGTFQEKLDLIANNDFARGFDTQATVLKAGLKEIGTNLGTLANTDLPAAQNAFKMISDEMKLNKTQQLDLLDAMPAYKDALYEQANALGVNVTSGTDAANSTNLVALALGLIAGSAETAAASTQNAASAYLDAAGAADELRDQINQLMTKIQEANGVGQDAVTANAAYQEALAGIADEVQRQKDAYEAVNGSLDGYTFSLDESTAAGSANAAMLTDVAAKGQASAEATYLQDLKTMSANDAANKYNATLAASRDALIQTAIQNGATAGEVQALTDKVNAMPTAREIRILAETAAAQQAIDNFITGNQGRTISVFVATNGNTASIADVFHKANGGLIPHLAGGSSSMWADGVVRGPGGPRDDRVPAMLSAGEFVVNAAATSRNLGVLQQMNAGVVATRQPAGYARGAGSGAAPFAATQPMINNFTINVTTMQGSDPQELERQVGRGVRDALRGLKT